MKINFEIQVYNNYKLFYESSMKKIILLLIIIGVLTAGVYFWQNFKGVWFAIKKPSRDIVEIIEKLPEKNNILETSESILSPDFPLNLPAGFSISIFAKGLGKPQEYWHNLLVVYHGSWNRSEPIG